MKPVTLQLAFTLETEAIATLAGAIRQAIGAATVQQAEVGSHGQQGAGASAPQRKMTPLEASRNALFRGQKLPEDRGLLIDIKEIAKLLDVSERTISSMQASGRIPAPIRIGRSVRWGYEEIRAWVQAGCPARAKWTWPRK